jgi:hypothetical protein
MGLILWPDSDRARKMSLELKEIRELDSDISYLRRKAVQLIDEWILTRERLQECRRRRAAYPLPDGRTK